MNVLDQSAVNSCTSCSVCATICVKDAISIVLNAEGFYRPIINYSQCIECGICTMVCYKFDDAIRITSKDDLSDKPLFSAWSNDDEIVKKTTSGGIGDLLAHQLQKDGYKVIGVVYNEDKTRAEHKTAESVEDLEYFRGSKYIQSYTFDAFREAIEKCSNEKFAVFGTPCQIYALNRYATKHQLRDNFVFVDLYCHGCPSLYAWTKCQLDIKKRNGVDKFSKVTFRSKVRGWGFFNILVESGEKRFFAGSKVNDKFYELFFSDQILNESCHDCVLRSTLEYTDIRIGDFWGKKYLRNFRGVSAVSVSTKRGKEIFDSINNQITSDVCKYEDFLPWQSWGKAYTMNINLRNAVLASLKNPSKDIDDAIRTLRIHQSVFGNIKRIIKTTFSFLPPRIINMIKKAKYSL